MAQAAHWLRAYRPAALKRVPCAPSSGRWSASCRSRGSSPTPSRRRRSREQFHASHSGLPAEEPARDRRRPVVREMAEHRYGSAVVLKGEQVVGVFTTTDALAVLAALLTGQETAERPLGPSEEAAGPSIASAPAATLHLKATESTGEGTQCSKRSRTGKRASPTRSRPPSRQSARSRGGAASSSARAPLSRATS